MKSAMNDSLKTAPQVIVIGAGPVGLSAALALDRLGVSSIVFEERANRGTHPKARGIRMRTMEIMRGWGLEDELRIRALPPEAMRFIYCDTLTDPELARSPAIDNEPSHSPTGSMRLAQDVFETALLAEVKRRDGIELRFETPVIATTQDDSGVTVTFREGEIERTQRAQYVIAADGVGSRTRESLGIEFDGPALLGWWQSIYWSGDISELVDDRPCIQFFTAVRSGIPISVASVDGEKRWISLIALQGEDRPAPLTTQEAIATVRTGVGRDIDVEVHDTTTWRLSAQIARRFTEGRIFLAGDAAHALPPTGGFGMNTGVQDVHNLAWKIAAVLNWSAHPALLDTYEQERKPVAQENADWSVRNSRRFVEIRKALAAGDEAGTEAALMDQKRHVAAYDRDLGFFYEQGAIVPDDTLAPFASPGDYVPSGRPGHRAPHMWLNVDGQRLSSLDLFEGRFVLFVTEAGRAWAAAAHEIPPAPLPTHVHRIAADEEDEFLKLYGIKRYGVVLVRPDGHVAFRSESGVDDPSQVLSSVRGMLLGDVNRSPLAYSDAKS